MKLRLKRKIILLALAFCFVFSSVFAETLAGGGHDHDCIGPFCPICLKIETEKCLKLISAILFFAGCLVFSSKIFVKKRSWFSDYPISPVMLKVRFNS